MLRRALTALTILFAGAAVLLLGFALAAPGGRAGAQTSGSTSPTSLCIGSACGASTTAAAPPSTAPATTSPPQTAAPATRPAATQPTLRTVAGTTIPTPTTTATTLPSIQGSLPVTPSTVPFTTKQQSSHVSPVFAALSGAGFFVALVIVVVRFITSRPPG